MVGCGSIDAMRSYSTGTCNLLVVAGSTTVRQDCIRTLVREPRLMSDSTRSTVGCRQTSLHLTFALSITNFPKDRGIYLTPPLRPKAPRPCTLHVALAHLYCSDPRSHSVVPVVILLLSKDERRFRSAIQAGLTPPVLP